MERCTTLLMMREMQIKITLRCHLIMVRMAIIKNCTSSKCYRELREKGTLFHCWWEWKLI